jgi:hypothetical protein
MYVCTVQFQAVGCNIIFTEERPTQKPKGLHTREEKRRIKEDAKSLKYAKIKKKRKQKKKKSRK